MSVTINANGLSIVHKGSGGEASATLPDVCLTTQGNAVIPILYGNSAKSSHDLWQLDMGCHDW
ncbi:hypothetical protein [Photobacterium nomapromontoriensis]|uniref:hypothetical protein n=1 Tax=Photobacterium nomapromontoriensis TaxID=2910237 RepID=UPI003D139EFE